MRIPNHQHFRRESLNKPASLRLIVKVYSQRSGRAVLASEVWLMLLTLLQEPGEGYEAAWCRSRSWWARVVGDVFISVGGHERVRIESVRRNGG